MLYRIVLSFIVTAFGQSAWIPGFGVLASVCGYALFWEGMLDLPRQRDRFWLAAIWFAAVQGVQFSWLATTEYMGPFILPFYLLLILGMGMQFGFLSYWIDSKLSWRKTLALAGGWVLCEGARLFFLCGCTWNPVGLSMACSPYSLQLASVGGIFGLSFWVIWTNLILLKERYTPSTPKSLNSARRPSEFESASAAPKQLNLKSLAMQADSNSEESRRRRNRNFGVAGVYTAWLGLALFPHLFGFFHQMAIETYVPPQKTVRAALIQTNLSPKQKDLKSPLKQWEEIFTALQGAKSLDLIVLPEAAVPIGAHQACYSFPAVQSLFPAAEFPPLRAPYALFYRNEWRVTNAFLTQTLANWTGAQVIIGLDDVDRTGKFNAAFHFFPGNLPYQRYEKQILAPVGEYIPLAGISWLARFIGDQFGIYHSFDAGKEGKIFDSHVPIGISICLEETFSSVVRELKRKGASLLVSISNDAYFPRTKLGKQHFDHGRIRAIENGIPLLRSCNSGVTAAIDCFGKPICVADPSDKVLFLDLPIRTYPTLYTWMGDGTIFAISFFFLVSFLLFPQRLSTQNPQTYKKELP